MDRWSALNSALASGRISRREFMTAAAALGVSASVATAAGSAAAAETPKQGGHLTVGLNGAGAGDSLDPATYTATFMQVAGLQIYDGLAETDEHNKVRPMLAESWEAKPGAKEWVFKLRRDVVFNNGKPLTAKDVVYTFNQQRQPSSKSPAKALLTSVVDVKATDTHEVTFTLSSGNADMPYVVADYHIGIGPEGTNFKDAVGTGPYTLVNFQPGVRMQTKRNPHYWRTDRGFVDTIETLAINDDTARMSALLSGSADLINRVDPKSVALLKRSPRVQIFEIAGAAHYTFPMRCDVAPFTDNNVRMGMKWATDRETMVRNVLLGHGRVGNDQPIPSFDQFYAADIPQRTFDPDKAKFYFKKANFTGPVTLSVSDGAFNGAVDAAEILAAGAAKAGITVNVNRTPADGYWDNVWMKAAWCASYWDGRPTADQMFSIVYKSDAPWNESFWKDPAFDKLLLAARSELDEAKRRQMYHDMQAMVTDNSGEIIPMFNHTIDAGSSRVRGFVQRPILQLGGYRAPSMVWLSS